MPNPDVVATQVCKIRNAHRKTLYLRYVLSNRDLEEIVAERVLRIDHTTIFRWVQHHI